MSQRDIHSLYTPTPMLGPITATTDQTGSAIALGTAHQAFAVNILVGVGGISFDDSNKIDFKLQKSSDGSTFEAVTQADVRGVTVGSGGIVKSLVAAHAAASATRIGIVKGDITHLKAIADYTGTHGTATPWAVELIKANPLIGPAA